MKKTLAAVAVLGAFAASASADVTVYGKIDLGLGYVNSGDVDTVEMVSGGSSTSRIGFKGSEKIGDMTVGFNYEIGGTADVGSFTTTNIRVSQLYVKGAYGELGFGRYGVLDAATGPYDLVGGLTQAGTGYYGIMDQSTVLHTNSRWNNAITYKSPSFGGVTVLAQVASGQATAEDAWGEEVNSEFTHNADMYYALGAQYKAGAFGASLVVSRTEYHQDSTDTATTAEDDRDQVFGEEDLNVTAGVNYDFGVAKVMLAANYYDFGDAWNHDQYGVMASVEAPLAGGTFGASVGYGEETEAGEEDVKVTTIGAFYKYPLSKQTYLYAAAGWNQEKEGAEEAKETRAVFGMCHNF